MLPKVQCICKLWFCCCCRPLPVPTHSTACSYRRGSGEGRWRGCPLCSPAVARFAAPLALAFSMPDRTLALIVANSSWLNTPAIWRKVSLIGSALPSRQSSVIDPTITIRRRFIQNFLSTSWYRSYEQPGEFAFSRRPGGDGIPRSGTLPRCSKWSLRCRPLGR